MFLTVPRATRSGGGGKAQQPGLRTPSSTPVKEPVAYDFVHLVSSLVVCKWGFDPLGSQNGVGKGVGIVGSIREKRFASAFWLAPQ